MYFDRDSDTTIPGWDFHIKYAISPTERERLRKCKEYHSSIKHTYLSLDDVKSMDGNKMFIAIIDFDDSKIFREKHLIFKGNTLFPQSTIIGNVDGNVYDFSNYFYLNLDKYRINFARSFSSIVDEDYWNFFYNEKKGRVELTFNSQSRGHGLGQCIILDKFATVRLGFGFSRYDLYDKNAFERVLGKGR